MNFAITNRKLLYFVSVALNKVHLNNLHALKVLLYIKIA